MTSKNYLLFISFTLILLTSSCGSVGWEHGLTQSHYTQMGWIKVDENDVNLDYSGYKRLLNEIAFDKGVRATVNLKGNPDYLYIPSRGQLMLAYCKYGIIYHFDDITAFGSTPKEIKYSSMHSSLPEKILTDFRKYDPTYSNIASVSKKETNEKRQAPWIKNKTDIKTVDNYVAVFDFEVRTGDKDISRSLADKVIHVFSESGKYEVIDRGNMNKILGEQKFQMSGCVAQECKVDAGQILGVGKIINGSVGLVGKTYYITLQLIDVKTGKIEISAEDECKCEVDELLGSTTDLAKKLLD